MSGVVRMCGPPVTPPLNTTEAPQQELPENRCYCDAEAADWFKKFLPVLDPGDLIVEGAICFCDHNGCNNGNFTESACDDSGVSMNKMSSFLLFSVIPLYLNLLI